MSRSEYCRTCHYKYLESMDKQAKHDPAKVGCTDCHVSLVAGGGRRYIIHDPRFDFSRDEVPSKECHDQETAAKEPPPNHDFNFKPVDTGGDPKEYESRGSLSPMSSPNVRSRGKDKKPEIQAVASSSMDDSPGERSLSIQPAGEGPNGRGISPEGTDQ
jgi:hypothetical protein